MDNRSPKELVEEALRLFGDVSGEDVSAILGGAISQPTISNWRRGDFKTVHGKKRELLRDMLGVWERQGGEPGRAALEAVARAMGLHQSERVARLTVWLRHPDILPKDMPLEERLRIGEATAEVEGYTKEERRQFRRWRDEMLEAANHESGPERVCARS